MQNKKQKLNWILFAMLLISIVSCKKDIQQTETIEVVKIKTEITVAKINPFSYENIKKAKTKIQSRDKHSSFTRNSQIEANRLYSYLKFNPNTINGNILKELEKDSTARILDFPFANGEIYNEQFALNESKAKQLADGNLYAVVKKNSPTEALLKGYIVNALQLDELYLPDETDTALQFQALIQAGYTLEELNSFRICLLKRPHDYVRYKDQETNVLKAVSGMQVWCLVFGIPLHTYTNNNGFYNIPWRFSLGTIMGTHAKNPRINIKPINTDNWGPSIAPPVLSVISNFIIGSTFIYGWVGSCAMNDEVNFHFTDHLQNRYWAQLMDAVNLHDQYSDADNIDKAPNNLSMYAHWDDEYGAAAAPMLGHLQYLPLLIEGIINGVFGGNVNLSNNFPNLFNLLTGLLPDLTVKVGLYEQDHYSSQLMQTVFHELSHASYLKQVGQSHYLEIMTAEFNNGISSGCGPYNCANAGEQQYVGLAEGWAEYLGTVYALRNHPNGVKRSTFFGGQFVTFATALEQERWFENFNIPTGVFNDLNDIANTNSSENIWDRTGGLSIENMYRTFEPNVTNYCNYYSELQNRFPNLNILDIFDIYINNGADFCF